MMPGDGVLIGYAMFMAACLIAALTLLVLGYG